MQETIERETFEEVVALDVRGLVQDHFAEQLTMELAEAINNVIMDYKARRRAKSNEDVVIEAITHNLYDNNGNVSIEPVVHIGFTTVETVSNFD